MASCSARLRKLSSLALVILGLVGVGVGVLGGCGDDIMERVACTTATQCGLPTDMTNLACCGGYCVAPSVGCTSGYRYITSEPEFGDCVEGQMCPIAADLSVAADLSMPNADAGK